MMKIGILQAGRTPDELHQTYGDYDDLYKRLLAGRGFDFDTYPVLDGIFPDTPQSADGWLVTGSRFGVYEPHTWITSLEQFLRLCFEGQAPIVGVCFGHQILAQALGGRVEKFSGGWSVGAVDYDLAGEEKPLKIMAWHQDQVVELPPGASVTGSSQHCRYAMLAYGSRAMSVQPHPEFTGPFMRDLIEARREVLPPQIAEQALETLDRKLSSAQLADRLEAFFKNSPGNRTEEHD